jgi:hypothetical protein
MCGSDAGGIGFCYSLSDRNVVRWLGIGRAVAEPQRTTAGVALDPNADNRGSCTVRKFCGLLELVEKNLCPGEEPAPLYILTYRGAGTTQGCFKNSAVET